MEAWKAHRSVMVQMPTGTGKTHLLASVVSEFVSSAGSGVCYCHRRELVAQMEETLAKYGIREGGYSGQGNVCSMATPGTGMRRVMLRD